MYVLYIWLRFYNSFCIILQYILLHAIYWCNANITCSELIYNNVITVFSNDVYEIISLIEILMLFNLLYDLYFECVCSLIWGVFYIRRYKVITYIISLYVIKLRNFFNVVLLLLSNLELKLFNWFIPHIFLYSTWTWDFNFMTHTGSHYLYDLFHWIWVGLCFNLIHFEKIYSNLSFVG